MFDKKNKFKTMTYKCWINYSLVFFVFLFFIMFGWLQTHNLYQTQYLIYYDFWRNFDALKEGNDIYPFVFHFIHTYVVASAIWYSDVLFAAGSLKLVHAYVVVATLISFYCVFLLIHSLHSTGTTPRSYIVFTALTVLTLWLSPSNANSFSYPLVDILAASLLLLTALAVIISKKWEETTSQYRVWPFKLAYSVIVWLGFLTLETFLIAPLVLAVDAILGRRRKAVVLHIVLVIALTTFYFSFIRQPPSEQLPGVRNFVALVHNFLVLLSSHFGLLFRAFETIPVIAGGISIGVSVLQLAGFIIFTWRHYTDKNRSEWPYRFPILLAIFGIFSIGLATWSRYGTQLMYDPVQRYTLYSVMFSIGVFLLASSTLYRRMNNAFVVLAFVIISVNIGYVVAEGGALLFRSHNAGADKIMARLEMPTYALSPGHEFGIGPSEPDGGIKWRSNLHSFLKERESSVFSSVGYRAVGTLILPQESVSDTICMRHHEAILSRNDTTYLLIYFEGVNDKGIFLLLNQKRHVINFSFSGLITPFDHLAFAMFPVKLLDDGDIYFARIQNGKLGAMVRCQ